MIDIQNISYTYPGSASPVLNDVTLSFLPGEFVALMGANGSGKSTLLRCLNGLLLPTSGRVTVDGRSPANSEDIPGIRREVGLVFQNPDDQIIASSVAREIAFGLENLGIAREEMHTRVDQMLVRFALSDYRSQDPNRLSGGERQRLALASIVVMSPKYLLLDEPTSLLDPGARREMLAYLHALHERGETTPILVTQIPFEAVGADRLVILDQGRVVLDGTPADIFAQIDTLQSLGLDAPLPARIAHRVGLPRPYPLTVEALADRLAGRGEASAPHPAKGEAPAQMAFEPTPSGSPLIAARGLCHIYDRKLPNETRALSDLTLDIYPGEIAVLVGPSGSGKSTFVHHLNGLLTPSAGALTVCGLHADRRKERRQLRGRVGLIFQFPEDQLFAETVFDDVAYGPRNLNLGDLAQRVQEALTAVGLNPEAFISRDPLRLSGGEKRRVAIAGVLAMGPDVLVLDEPTAGLDPSGARRIEDLLLAQKKQGRTVVMITHDLDLAARLADRVYLFHHGRVNTSGQPFEILTSPSLEPLGLHPPESIRLLESLQKKGVPIGRTHITPDALIAFFRRNSP
jgi:energy-coupling factor transport system ATP-binding protein